MLRLLLLPLLLLLLLLLVVAAAAAATAAATAATTAIATATTAPAATATATPTTSTTTSTKYSDSDHGLHPTKPKLPRDCAQPRFLLVGDTDTVPVGCVCARGCGLDSGLLGLATPNPHADRGLGPETRVFTLAAAHRCAVAPTPNRQKWL